MIAHIGSLPAEEVGPALAGTASGLVVVRAWMIVRWRRRRRSGT